MDVSNVDNTGEVCYHLVKRWGCRAPGGDIFSLDKLFIPINKTRLHWMLVVVFMQERKVVFLDPFHSNGHSHRKHVLRYLQEEHRHRHGTDLPNHLWSSEDYDHQLVPYRLNGFDCGVFVCMYVDHLSCDIPMSFAQAHTHLCRLYMAHVIHINGKIPLFSVRP